MPIYYIAMGQGILGQGPKLVANTDDDDEPWTRKGPNFYVQTSTLPSCTLICGFNSTTGRGGAFHYPNGLRLKKTELSADEQTVLADMDNWKSSLQPTHVTLINVNGATHKETLSVAQWVHPAATEMNYVFSKYGGMEIRGDVETGLLQFNAGNPNPGFGLHLPDMEAFDMRGLPAGTYAQRKPPVDLFGTDTSGGALGSEDIDPNVKPFPLGDPEQFSDTDEEDSDSSDDDSGEGDDSKENDNSK